MAIGEYRFLDILFGRGVDYAEVWAFLIMQLLLIDKGWEAEVIDVPIVLQPANNGHTAMYQKRYAALLARVAQ